MRQPGIEPGPLPWKGRILTIRPLTLYRLGMCCLFEDNTSKKKTCIDMNCYKLYITFLGIVIGVEILISIRLAFACTQL